MHYKIKELMFDRDRAVGVQRKVLRLAGGRS
jgi:hypothetical protein